MDNPSSPLETLRQLKEMLDAGALTPTEFESLKQRLVFTDPPIPQAPPAAEPAPSAPFISAPAPIVPAAPVPPAVLVPPPVFTPAPPPSQQHPVVVEDASQNVVPSGGTASPVGPPWAGEEWSSEVPPSSFTAPPTAPAPAPDADASWVTSEFPEAAAPAARSPLALILSIGGLLALLALVVYLSMNRPPSERLTSTSQTAADSVAATIEVGPQAEPLSRTEAVPETIRVVPTNPAPIVPARPRATVRDSTADSTRPDSALNP
ncbi:SHOCT domain-containing protein [Hymenobacter glacialis]|uniref:SHOCT domain-containing protein n=1 Tax=Hymenobacter glacialis TaxID=1908236 RepID=A0A1G1SWE5_9BACT|nr:SHOCT domain-containing protein [Hymenobacter glacialis]OGX82946.1 hypothetical protein BEN48_04065 [Hymenobacter glacialis]